MNNTIKNIIAVVAILLIGYAIYSAPKPETNENSRVMAPEDVSVAVGETKEVMSGLFLTLNEVTNDYRCPVDANCIEGGAINTNITLREGDTTLNTFYSSDGVYLSFNGYNVSIVGVLPELYSGQTINPSDYVVTFHIESALTDIVDNPDYSGGAAGGTVPADENPCMAMGGQWDGINGECLGVSANVCQEIGGDWNECASACRNDPYAEVCTMQCVQVCDMK